MATPFDYILNEIIIEKKSLLRDMQFGLANVEELEETLDVIGEIMDELKDIEKKIKDYLAKVKKEQKEEEEYEFEELKEEEKKERERVERLLRAWKKISEIVKETEEELTRTEEYV